MSTTISGTNGVTFPDSTSMQTGQQACKAWVNFNGTGTVAIRAQYNVSSITDNGTGDYTVNFTTAMPDANYAVEASCSPSFALNMAIVNINASNGALAEVAPTTSALQMSVRQSAASQIDVKYMNVAIFR
jgi:hypothetical protein